MKAILVEKFGGSEVLKLGEISAPTPQENEIQIKIKYSGVNPVDWKIREGLLKTRLPTEFPFIPGWDAAGVVTLVGSGVSNLKEGDEVYAYCRMDSVKWGTYAEYICINAENAALKPENLTFAEASCIPLAGLTAWQSLFQNAKLKGNETILIHAGAGGVGSFAIQFAKYAGAKVITTATEVNREYVKELGADLVIDYTNENFVDVITHLHSKGIDIVFDTIGGETMQKSLSVLKQGGRLVSLIEQLDSDTVAKHMIQFSYVFVTPSGSELAQIAKLIEDGKIVPPTIEEMTLSRAAEAQEKVKEGHTQGKIVLKIS